MGKHAFEMRVAAGTPDGPRSRTWKIWVPRGKNDVYLSCGADTKASLHDPGETREGDSAPWAFGLDSAHFDKPNPLVPRDRRRLVEWGVGVDLGPEAVAVAQVITPGSELRIPRDEEPERRSSVTWLPTPREDQAAFVTVYLLPLEAEGVTFTGPRPMLEHRVHELPNGRTVAVVCSVTSMSPLLRQVLDRTKAAGREALWRDLATADDDRLEEGPSTFVGVKPLARIGQMQALLELHLESFELLSRAAAERQES